MVRILIISVIFLISGCAELKAVVGTYGSEASDESLESAIWVVCSATPIGAYKRKFVTPESQEAVEVICAL